MTLNIVRVIAWPLMAVMIICVAVLQMALMTLKTYPLLRKERKNNLCCPFPSRKGCKRKRALKERLTYVSKYEGNGRTQRVFFTQLIRNAGYDIQFALIDADELMVATIQAAGGVEDSLRTIFRRAITDT